MRLTQAAFPKRPDRTAFIFNTFGAYLGQSVLDVGCFEAPMREMIGSERYTGVDVAGNPDITLNLETCIRLPFEEERFETVMCMDVLEHLDNLHAMSEELVRVSRRYVLISLPNCWNAARVPMSRGHGSFAHYGLPLQKPLDRHKWFFNTEEGYAFLCDLAARHGLKILDAIAVENPRNPLKRTLRRLAYSGMRYANRYAHTLFILMEKPAER